MDILTNGNFVVRIPENPSRVKANCSKEWGAFVDGECRNMSALEAKEEGLILGKKMEMAVCWVTTKILTFEPHYVQKKFLEIWGIPVAGAVKDRFHPSSSQLTTFLIHGQSMDRFQSNFEKVGRDAFNEWVGSGMVGSPESFMQAKMVDVFLKKIFVFEMQSAEGGYGSYFWVKASQRPANGEMELAALEIASEIYGEHSAGTNMRCIDLKLEQNQAMALGETEPEALAANPVKKLKGSK